MEDSKLCDIFRKIHDLEAAVELRSGIYREGQQDIKKSKSKLDELTEELDQVKQHIVVKEGQLASVKQELTLANVQLEALTKCAAEIDDKVRNVENQEASSSSQIDSMEDAVMAECDATLNQWQQLTSGYLGMSRALDKISHVAGSLQPEHVTRLQTMVDEKNQELDRSMEHVAELKLELRHAIGEIAGLEEEKKALESET